jgi:hypothetical protein
MNTQELLPFVSGLLLGSLLGLLRPSRRVRVGAVLTIVSGVLATLASGEFRTSWAFLGIDIPLVAVSAAAGLVGMNAFRWSRRNLPDKQGPMGRLS